MGLGIGIAPVLGMLRLERFALALPLFLCACPDDGSEPGGPEEGPPDEPPAPEVVEVAGTYHSLSQWNLSSAITEHPGVGTIVADLVIEQVVSLAGVPSPLEDAAREKVAAVVHEPIREYVDSRVPSILVPESELLTELGAILGDVDVESDIELAVAATDDTRLTGRETLLSLELRRGERSLRLPVDGLAIGNASVPIGANISGDITAGTALSIAPHSFALRFDVLLAHAATELLGVLDAETLGQQVSAALECAQIVEHITGGNDSITIEVGGMTFTAGLEDLLDGCEFVRIEITDYALGLINPDLGIAVGGSANAIDADGDAIAERLVSGADYSGLITSIPLPTPTRFNASFTAARK
jgi:hypothetical protein